MKNENELVRKNIELSFEFSRYVLANPQIDEQIPENAQILFEIEDDPELTAFNHALARRTKESNQPLVVVRIKRLLPTRLLEPHVSFAGA